MKRTIVVLFFAIFYLVSNGQDSLGISITSGCLNLGYKSSQGDCPAGIFFGYSDDSLSISGRFGANCCGTHLALVSVINDTIYISTSDTGDLCLCTCTFCFDIKLPASVSDTIVIFNGTIYNSNTLKNSVRPVIRNEILSLYPNPVSDLLTIASGETHTGINRIEIIGLSGKTLADYNISRQQSFTINLNEYRPGLYFTKIWMDDGKVYFKKIIKL